MPTISCITMATKQPEWLIHSILAAIADTKEEGGKRNKFINAMLSKLETFHALYATNVLSTDTYDKLIEVFKTVPEHLEKNELEAYVLYLHQLLKQGELYGMVHEDPYATMTLVSSSITILKILITEQGRTDLIPLSIDMMLMQNFALLVAGGNELAAAELTQILKVAQSKEDVEKEFNITCDHTLYNAVQLHAARCAAILAEVLNDLTQEKKAAAARTMAKMLFKCILENEKVTISNTDKLTAIVTLAELALYEHDTDESDALLELAIKHIDLTLQQPQEEADDIPYRFVASIVLRKLAMYKMAKEIDFEETEKWCRLATKLAAQCCVACPNNTHYQDHYGELLTTLGVVQGVVRNFDKANDTFTKAIEVSRKLVERSEQYNTRLVVALSNMAILMQKTEQTQEAEQYIREAEQIIAASTDRHLLQKNFMPAELLKMELSRRTQESKQLSTPTNKLWAPIGSGDPNKYGAN